MENKISEKYKKMVDEVFSKQTWEIEESCLQELYAEISFNMHFEFCHKGHNYFITWDVDKNKNHIWVIYDRDYSNPAVAYKNDWDIEPRMDYPDLPSLFFEYKLRNDGRTLAEYCYDYWKQERSFVPEPVDKNLVRKVWRH